MTKHECEGCGAPLALHRDDCEYCRRPHGVVKRFNPQDSLDRLRLVNQYDSMYNQQAFNASFNNAMQSQYGSQQNSLNSLLGLSGYGFGWVDHRSGY